MPKRPSSFRRRSVFDPPRGVSVHHQLPLIHFFVPAPPSSAIRNPPPLFLSCTGNGICRNTSNMQGARQRFERPVSCRFCRSRKLRCSREAPCSNCVSRGIACELPVKNANIQAAGSSSREPELLERIRKLEELVANGNSAPNTYQTPDSPHSLRTHTRPSTLSPDIEHLDDDVAWLKSIYTTQDLSVSGCLCIARQASDLTIVLSGKLTLEENSL